MVGPLVQHLLTAGHGSDPCLLSPPTPHQAPAEVEATDTRAFVLNKLGKSANQQKPKMTEARRNS